VALLILVAQLELVEMGALVWLLFPIQLILAILPQ
jgi:hypothetical protein